MEHDAGARIRRLYRKIQKEIRLVFRGVFHQLIDLGDQIIDLAVELFQPADIEHIAHQALTWHGGKTAHHRARRHVAAEAAHGHDDGVVADHHMIGDARRAADDHTIADGGAAGNADATADQTVFADHHIVADLNLIIDFSAVADARGGDGATVNGSVRGNLDLVANDDGAEAGDTHQLAVGR